MDHAGVVGGGERGQEVLHDREDLELVQRAARGELGVVRAAVEPLHHEELPAVAERTDVVDVDDAGVRDPVHRVGLADEPAQRAARDEVRVQHLERDGAAQPDVAGAIDGREPAARGERLDAVRSDDRAGREAVAVEPPDRAARAHARRGGGVRLSHDRLPALRARRGR